MARLALSRRGCIITMAERYQERPFPAEDYDRGDPHGAGRGESDPLAELARLIGQTDPHAALPNRPRIRCSRARNIRPQYNPPEQYDLPEEVDSAPPSPPTWMQRPGMKPRRHRRRRTTTTSRNTSRRRCIPCIAISPAAAALRGPAAAGACAGLLRAAAICRRRAAAGSVALRRCALRPDRIRRAGLSARSGLSGRSLRLSERL